MTKRTAKSKVSSSPEPELAALAERWKEAWPEALFAWSKYTRLRQPTLCLTSEAAAQEGLRESFAMIRFADQAVVIDLQEVETRKLRDYAREILAHEIGHHVLAPANLSDHARMIARMRYGLPTVEHWAPFVANLYTDLLINDRLQRRAGLRLAEVFRALRPKGDPGAVWKLYYRIYELLWSLPRTSLTGVKTTDIIEGDAHLGARLLRSYARDWIDGAGRFAALFLPHLIEDKAAGSWLKLWNDTSSAGAGGDPAGLTEVETGEKDGAIHPARDPALSEYADIEDRLADEPPKEPTEEDKPQQSQGQCREPFQYGEILSSAGIKLSPHEIAVRYYRERARPYLVPYPSRSSPVGGDPLPEGLEPWDIGSPLDEVDWLQSVLCSPHVIPGMTTVQRVVGVTEGASPHREPLDLDLYVDSSGSMANPQHNTSYPALAGAIICLSALRAGAKVQVTLWSGAREFLSTEGFVRDREAILTVLTGYLGGGTAFPIHVLRDTFAQRRKAARPVHIMVISDDGVTTLFDKDERGNSGWDVSAQALARAGGGGTFVLNLPADWEDRGGHGGELGKIRRARDQHGWRVFRVATWDELVGFAREFSKLEYGERE